MMYFLTRGSSSYIACLLVVATIGTPALASGRLHRSKAKIADEYVVTLHREAATTVVETAHALALQHGGIVRRVYKHAIIGFAVHMTEAQAVALSHHPAVELVEENALGEPSARCPGSETPCLTATTAEWNLDRIDTWTDAGSYSFMTVFSPSRVYPVIVYPFDTGMNRLHDEFRYRPGVPDFWPSGDGYRVAQRGWDFVECTGCPLGETGTYGAVDPDICGPNINGSHQHGTGVASFAGGLTYGAAKHVDIFPIRVVSCTASTHLQRVITAIDHVIAESATSQTAVANFSFYFDAVSNQSALDTAINSLIDRNFVVVTSANNHNMDRCAEQSPARVPRAITVGSTTNNPMDARAVRQPDPGPCGFNSKTRSIINCDAGSNWGSCVDIFAPAMNVNVAGESDSYLSTSPATSFASALVSGIAAGFLEQFPNATPADVWSYIQSQAESVVTNVPTGTTRLLVTVRPEGY